MTPKRWLTLLAIALAVVFDPLRDLWYPCIPPIGGSHWWDLWHCIKHLAYYPPLIALLWWMWPLWERKYWNFFGYLDGGVVYLHVMYWAIAGLLSQGIWRLVIYLAGGW